MEKTSEQKTRTWTVQVKAKLPSKEETRMRKILPRPTAAIKRYSSCVFSMFTDG